jgi:hypothetical protein
MSGHKKAGAIPGSWNEGVGEHVRTRSRPVADKAPVKPRNDDRSAPNEEKPFLLPHRSSSLEEVPIRPLT